MTGCQAPGHGPNRRPVLVVNAGSTSLKLHLVDEAGEARALASLDVLAEHVAAVGHRIVHGGPELREPVVVDAAVERSLEAATSLARLHNTAALRALEHARDALPDAVHVAVFDTAFHASIPPEASTYAVPERWRAEWGVRRYGFHGLAVEWAARRVRARRLVVCHLGGGSSVTAVLDGRSVDTTMGLTPLEGVPMVTRSGSVDPGALLYLLRERGLAAADVERALEHESGLAALGGLDSELGFAVFTYRVAAAVAAMAVALGGVDAVAFSGGIGENRKDVRDAVLARLLFLGDVRVEVVAAREELLVAEAVRRVLGPAGSPAG